MLPGANCFRQGGDLSNGSSTSSEWFFCCGSETSAVGSGHATTCITNNDGPRAASHLVSGSGEEIERFSCVGRKVVCFYARRRILVPSVRRIKARQSGLSATSAPVNLNSRFKSSDTSLWILRFESWSSDFTSS